MNTSRTDPQTIPAMDVECPWCAAQARVEGNAFSGAGVATFTCQACSIVVAISPDPALSTDALAA